MFIHLLFVALLLLTYACQTEQADLPFRNAANMPAAGYRGNIGRGGGGGGGGGGDSGAGGDDG